MENNEGQTNEQPTEVNVEAEDGAAVEVNVEAPEGEQDGDGGKAEAAPQKRMDKRAHGVAPK